MYVIVIYSIILIFIINSNYLLSCSLSAWCLVPGAWCHLLEFFSDIIIYIIILKPGTRNPKPETRNPKIIPTIKNKNFKFALYNNID